MSPLGVLTLAVIAVAIYDAVVLEPRRYTRAAPEPFADNGRPRGIAPAVRDLDCVPEGLGPRIARRRPSHVTPDGVIAPWAQAALEAIAREHA